MCRAAGAAERGGYGVRGGGEPGGGGRGSLPPLQLRLLRLAPPTRLRSTQEGRDSSGQL
jgi:hypothetical protein